MIILHQDSLVVKILPNLLFVIFLISSSLYVRINKFYFWSSVTQDHALYLVVSLLIRLLSLLHFSILTF